MHDDTALGTDTQRIAPPGALTWDSPAQRNRRLRAWRKAVSLTFAEQPRCLRVAWALDHLFNARTGFCNASNTYLASETGLTPRNLQKALAALESDGALVRGVTVQKGGQRWRAIYPAKAILTVMGSRLPVDMGGHVHQVDVQNLRRIPRMPKSQLAYARLAAGVASRTATAPQQSPQPQTEEAGHPSDGVTGKDGAPPATPEWRS
jgi:hypothetical protein